MSIPRPFLIVTGAGRSGTSAVARVLHESGLRMGHEMAAASEANLEGFYEDLGVVALNERILTDAGMNDPWRPERWPARETIVRAGAVYRDEMVELARTDVAGWKDPRFSITLEAWLPALPAPPKVIVCLRSPQAYADSVTRIYGLVKPARAIREWARQYRRLMSVIRRYKLAATCVEYDALVEQPGEAVAALARFVGRPLDASYVVPRLRREFAPVPEAHRALYEQVAALGDGPTASLGAKGPRPGVTPRVATPAYDRIADGLVGRLIEAKDTWESVVGMPAFELNDESPAACERYNAVLVDAQNEVAPLVPPEALAQKHATLVRRVNVERMIAELSSAAASSGDERTRGAAVRAWQKFGRRPIEGASPRAHEGNELG